MIRLRDRSLIEKKELVLAIRLRKFGFSEQAVYLQVRQFLCEFDEVFGELFAVEQTYPLQMRIAGADIKDGSAVVRQ